MRIIVGSGNARKTIELLPSRDARRLDANTIKRAFFPSNAAYHQAKRRGDKALAASA